MKKYTLSTKGLYDFDTELTPIWYILEKSAMSVAEIKEALKEYADCFAIPSKVERGMDNEEEIRKWIKALTKKGWLLEVATNEVVS